MNTKLHLKRKFLLGLSILSMITLVNCSDFDEEDPVVDTRSSENTFGIRHDLTLADYEKIATNASPYDTDEHPDFSPIVAFTYSLDGSSDYEFVATGTLVKPDWILTAGHNFFVSENQTSPAPVSGITVCLGNDPNDPDQTFEVAELVFHPTWLEDDVELFGTANDLCLVKLKTSITSVTPAIINDKEVEQIGEMVWYGGFGDYSTQPGQNPDDYSKKHAFQNILDRTANDLESKSSAGTYIGGLLSYDFDSPAGDVNPYGDDVVSEDEMLVGGSTTSSATPLPFEACAVQGDSGGPLYMKIDGEWKICGVLSGAGDALLPDHKDGNYGEIDFYTRTATAYDWISSVIN
ncbi:MAG: trypsin-like serine protease [Cyclobacteriaceae bacterium]